MITIDAEKLRAFVREVVRRAGSEGDEPGLVAEHLVGANLAGHDSHGVGILPLYASNIEKGLLVPNRHAELVQDGGAITVVDGGRGYGQVVAREATELAIERARAHGVAVLALRNAHHIGRIGAWGEMCAAAGFVSMHYVNVIGHPPLVAPFRGTDARYATNPYCCALPALGRRPPVLLDMATAMVAVGKIRVAMNRGETVAEDTLIDAAGRPTVDPAVMFTPPTGALLPFGAHKGYGLGLICELLGGALTGGGTIAPESPRDGRIINNMLAIVIDPTRLVDREYLAAEIDRMLDYATASPPSDPQAPVLVPGDPERAARAARARHGISIDDTTWAELVEVASSVGLARAQTRAMTA